MWGSVMRDASASCTLGGTGIPVPPNVHESDSCYLGFRTLYVTQSMRLHLAGFIVVCEMYEAFT